VAESGSCPSGYIKCTGSKSGVVGTAGTYTIACSG
jgi:hypothetical protein